MEEYKILLTPEIDGGYMVSIPDLPGCITQGETIIEALHMADKAITLYLEELADRDKTNPCLG